MIFMRNIRFNCIFLAACLLAAACGWSLFAGESVPVEKGDKAPADKVAADAGSNAPNPESIRLRTMDKNIVEIGSDVVIKENENAPEAVIVFGSVIVNGRVDRDLVVIGGNAVINGQVGGNVVVVLGYANVGPKAEIDGDTTVIGGHLTTEPGAKLRRTPFNLSLGLGWLGFGWFKDWLFKGLFWARPMVPQLGWMWCITGILFVFYAFVSLALPKPVQACVSSLETKPLVASLVGLLAFVFISPFTLLLVASVAGLLAIPFILCGLVVGILIGKIALYQYIGKQIGSQLGVPALSSPLIALTVGMSVFCLFYIIPVLGLIVWGLALPLGLGSVLMALVTAFVKETTPKNNPAPPPYSQSTAGPSLEISPAPHVETAYLPRAGFWIRCFATVVDLILLALAIPLVHGLWPLLWIFYHGAMWAWKGTTIGGIVFGLKVVRVDGRPLDFSISLVRCLGACLSVLPFFLGFFWAGWDKERQSWHDKIAGTTIVKIPKGIALI
jgi:hypothetical protein